MRTEEKGGPAKPKRGEIDVFSWTEAEKAVNKVERTQGIPEFKEETYKDEYKKAIADGKIVKTEEELLKDLEKLLQLSKEEAQRLRSEVEQNEDQDAGEPPKNSSAPKENAVPYFTPGGFIPDEVSKNSREVETTEGELMRSIERKLLESERMLVKQNWANPENYNEITWMSLYERGLEYFKSGLFEQSLYYFDKALSLEPNSFKLWASKGMSLFWLNEPKAAMKCINKSLKLNPRNYRAWSNKGIMLKQRGDMKKAVNCFNRALKYNARYANGWYEKGQIAQSLAKYKTAVKYYDRALKIAPGNKGALFFRNECIKIIGYAK